MRNNPPGSLTDTKAWQREGARLGRQNLPGTPDGDTPLRSLLRSHWALELTTARADYVREVDEADHRARLAANRMDAIEAMPKTHPQRDTFLATAKGQLAAADQNRRERHTAFLQTAKTITAKAEACDGVWRTANEFSRDRRITLTPTTLVVPAGLLDPLPDRTP